MVIALKSKVKFPIFVMDKKSLLETFADSLSYVNLFARIGDEKTVEDRMIAVVKWYLSLFHPVILNETALRKPLNPILGEVFKCSWRTDAADSCSVAFVAEQVSHHPTSMALIAANSVLAKNV